MGSKQQKKTKQGIIRIRITGWLGREVAGGLARWLKSHTAVTAFRRMSSSTLCGYLRFTLSYRDGSPRRVWARHILRDHPQLGSKVRIGRRATTPTAPLTL